MKLILFSLFLLIDKCYTQQSQTLLINYYNNTNCSNRTIRVDTYNDDIDCYEYDNYGQCCEGLLEKYEDKYDLKYQKIETCYKRGNTTSYLYDCKYKGKFSYNHRELKIFAIVIGSLVMATLMYSMIYYCYCEKKYRNYEVIN